MSNLSTTQRRYAMTGLFGAVALAAIGYIPALSVAPLVAEDLVGSPRWSGLPGAVTVLGMALGASILSRIMELRGRNFGLLFGFAVAAVAIVGTAAGVVLGSLALVLITLFVFGAGYGARHLARYAAGDLYPRERRGAAISLVVWAGTIGAVLGPLLLQPSQDAALRLGAEGLVGPYLLAAIASVLAWLLLRFLVPPLPGTEPSPSPSSRREPPVGLPIRKRTLLGSPQVRFALVAMMVGQFVMVLIMSMTPVHIRHAGEGLSIVGLVFSAHTFGMFALSPLTGFLADRWGRLPVIFWGEAMLLAAALLAAPAAGDDRVQLVLSLFLLGLGWNFGFVAGSALLSESVPDEHRVRAQGLADTIVWTSAAAGSTLAGLLLAVVDYSGLSLIGAATVTIPPLTYAWLFGRNRRRESAPGIGGKNRTLVPPSSEGVSEHQKPK